MTTRPMTNRPMTNRPMTNTALRSIALAAVLLLVATSAQALFFTVTLKNGTTFETRYRPVQAEWDPQVSMFLTDRGNWVAIPNEDIADVVSVFEESGFGYQLDTSTRFIGWSPNDLVETKVDEDGNVTEEVRYDAEADQGGDVGAGAGYSVDQFLNLPTGGSYGNPTALDGGVPLYDDLGEDPDDGGGNF